MASWLIVAGGAALAAQPTPPPGAPAPAPAPKLADLPNVEITHYPVTGKTIRQIHKSLAEAAPKDPVSGKRLPTTSSWSISAGVKWTTTGARCEITAVDLRFSAKAAMPRLLVTKDIPPEVQAVWNNYLARIEARQAEQLAFAYDRRSSVERAIRAGGCAAWQAEASLAIDKIMEEQAQALKQDDRAQPKLLDPDDPDGKY